jgi:hypothetical protein
MVRLEELTKGTQVKGILPNSLITIVDAQWHGSDVVELTYKDASGALGNELVFRDKENSLELATSGSAWSFTAYLGSAPSLRAANRGLEDRRVKLGCVQPGEIVSTFSDALRRLTDQATHLYIDNTRYWFSTQPSVTRLAQDRAEQIQQDTDKVWEEIIGRLRSDKQRGEFTGVHIAPENTADVPDETGVRLVVLAPQHSHKSKEKTPKH